MKFKQNYLVCYDSLKLNVYDFILGVAERTGHYRVDVGWSGDGMLGASFIMSDIDEHHILITDVFYV